MKRGIVAHVSFLSSAQYVSQLLFLVRGLVLARLLGPAAFGMWSAMRLVLFAGRFTNLGTVAGMVQHAPRAEGQGDDELAERYRATAAWLNLLGGAAFAAVLAAALWFGGSPPLWHAIPAVFFAVNLFEFRLAALRSQRRFGAASTAMVKFAALSTGLGLVGAARFGLNGFVLALGVSYVIVLAGCWREGGLARPVWDARRARELVGVGSPILASEVLQVLLWNTDKLLLWILVGNEALGIYSVQATITFAIMLLPVAVSRVVHPHLSAELGEAADVARAWPYLERGTIVLAQVACPMLGVLFLALHLPIEAFLPEYVGTIGPGRVLVLASYFSIVSSVPATVLIALGAQRRLLAVRALSVVVSFVAIGVAIISGGSLTAVAVGAGLGFLTQSVLAITIALRVAGLPSRRCVSLLAGVATPFAVLVLLLVGFDRVLPAIGGSWTRDIVETAIKSSIVLAVLVPWALRAVRRLVPPSSVAIGR